MASTSPSAFEEGSHLEKEEKMQSAYIGDQQSDYVGPQLNATNKNSSNSGYGGKPKKSGGFCSNISKNTLCCICLGLLLLALLLPILILASLIYKNMNKKQDVPVASARNALEGQKNVAGEEAGVPDAKDSDEYQKQMEEIYKKEPWRKDPTNAWKQLGTSLSQSIDDSNDPCADFYAYSCNQWQQRNPLNGREEISVGTGSTETVKGFILNTFAGMKNDDATWPASVRWAKRFYDRCTTADATELAARRRAVTNFLSYAFNSAGSAAKVRQGRSADQVVEEIHTAVTSNATAVNTTSSESGTVLVQGHNATDTVPALPVPAPPVPDHSSPPVHSEVEMTTVESIHNVNAGAVQGEIEPENASISASEMTLHVTEAIPLATISTEGNETEVSEVNETVVESHVPVETAPEGPTESEGSVWTVAGALSKLGIPSLFNVLGVNSKDSNASKTILSPPTLSLKSRREYLEPYLFSKLSPTLEKLISTKSKELKESGSPNPEAVFPDDSSTASGIVQFEQALARASPKASADEGHFGIDELQSHIPNAKSFSFSNLLSRWPSVNWQELLPGGRKKRSNQSSETNETASIIVTDLAYIDQLVGLVEDNDRKTIINYLKWRYVFSVSDYLNQSSERLNSTCYKTLEDSLPLALAHVIYKTNYSLSKEEKDAITFTPESTAYIFNRTVRSFKSVLEFSNQIPNASKKSLNDELDKRVLVTQWPNFITDSNALDNLYTPHLANSENSTFMEMLNSALGQNGLDESASAWSEIIPRAFTETTFLSGDQIAMVNCPRILNAQLSSSAVGQFSTIGWQLARALAKSIRFSPNAPMQNSQIDQCLINQYNQFCYQPPVSSCVDGAATLEENFSDNVALEVAYKMYTTWASVTSASGSSDAFPAYIVASNLGKFTMDQIFLLAYGASFCNNEASEYTSQWLASQSTAPKQYRLAGTVQNLDDFQLAFRCKPGDKMNRNAKERCQL